MTLAAARRARAVARFSLSLAVVMTIPIGAFVAVATFAWWRLVAHRVVQVIDRPNGRWLQTQGDANHTPDSRLLPVRGVRGRVAWVIPRLGSVSHAIVTRGAIALLVLAVIGALQTKTASASRSGTG